MDIVLKKQSRLHVDYLPIADLVPDPKNPRKHSADQIAALARAIGELGFNNPILVDGNNTVIAGHGRLEAAKLQSLEQVPTIRLEHLTPAQVKAYRIADNRLAELAQWDMEALKFELQSLAEIDPGLDLTLTGFEMPKIDLMLNPVLKDEPEEDVPIPNGKEAVTQSGDIWVLGTHRVICGDALDPDTYKRLLGDEWAHLVFTDPPYNVPVKGHILANNKHGHGEFAMAAGEMTDEEFQDFLAKVIDNLRHFSDDGSIHFICMDWRHIRHLLAAGMQYDELKNICIWNKSNGGMGSLYRSKHEMIAVFKNGEAPHVNNIELGKHGRYRTNVWDYAGQSSINSKTENDIALHPTPKPVQMVMDALLDCSNRGQIVLDAFGGSGSALIAAEKTQRHARLIEIKPRYVDVIIRRWQDLTKQQAVLQSSGATFAEVQEERLGGGDDD